MAFDELREFFDPALVLPIGGVEYRVESPTAREGLRLRLLLGDDGATLGDEQEVTEWTALLGPSLERMRSDGVAWPEIVHAGRTALLYFGMSAGVGLKHWERGSGGPGNSLPPDPATVPGVA